MELRVWEDPGLIVLIQFPLMTMEDASKVL